VDSSRSDQSELLPTLASEQSLNLTKTDLNYSSYLWFRARVHSLCQKSAQVLYMSKGVDRDGVSVPCISEFSASTIRFPSSWKTCYEAVQPSFERSCVYVNVTLAQGDSIFSSLSVDRKYVMFDDGTRWYPPNLTRGAKSMTIMTIVEQKIQGSV
jgi:hypothetical protein